MRSWSRAKTVQTGGRLLLAAGVMMLGVALLYVGERIDAPFWIYTGLASAAAVAGLVLLAIGPRRS